MTGWRWPWTIDQTPTPDPDPATLHHCPQCGHTAGLLDEHWLNVTRSASGAPVVQVCSPRCAALWLEQTFRQGVPQ